MRHVLWLAAVVCACVVMERASMAAGSRAPSRVTHDYPPVQVGARETVWLGPYVSADQVRIGEHWQVAIRWFDREGRVVREVLQPGGVISVSDYVEDGKVLHSVNGDWSFSPVEREGIYGLTATPDAYLISYNPEEDLICGDLYWHGRLVATVGPFYQHIHCGFNLGADGSMAIIAWDGPERKAPQVIAMTRTGEVRVRADCYVPEEGAAIVAPGARGAIVDPMSAYLAKTFFGSDGRQVTFPGDLGRLLWLPDTTRVLVGTAFGYEVIDCRTGAIVWRLELPHPERVEPLGLAEEYILFWGVEPSDSLGSPPPEVRTLYAVETATGQIAAQWLPGSSHAHSWGARALRLRQRDGKYYLLYDGAFSVLDLEDVRAKRNGWR